MGEYEDFVYLFKCEKETWTSGVGQLYTYYGVNSAGEVKEFESYNEGREGTPLFRLPLSSQPLLFLLQHASRPQSSLSALPSPFSVHPF